MTPKEFKLKMAECSNVLCDKMGAAAEEWATGLIALVNQAAESSSHDEMEKIAELTLAEVSKIGARVETAIAAQEVFKQ